MREHLDYMGLMWIHNLRNSSNRPATEMLSIEVKNKYAFANRMKTVAGNLGISLLGLDKVKKSAWKKMVKTKIMDKIQERLKKETQGRTKSRFLENDKWGQKNYIKILPGEIAIEVAKIRLNMSNLKVNYHEGDLMCVRCGTERDTSEHVVSCISGLDPQELRNQDSEQWPEIVEAFTVYEGEHKYEKEKIRLGINEEE